MAHDISDDGEAEMSELEITDLTPAIGAQVAGLDPSTVPDAEVRRRLQEAFDDRGLLVFRDLDVEFEFQAALSEMLIGMAPRSDAHASYISNEREDAAAPFGRLLFHSDTMWADEPLLVLSLWGERVELPSVPTLYASTTHAWETLPEDLKARVSERSAVHVAGQHPRDEEEDADVLESAPEHPSSTTTPIARRHPRTGRTMLYVCEQMTHEIVGMTPDESAPLLAALFEHLYDPANVVEHHWRDRDLVIWDNLAVQHGRPNVRSEGPARTLRKFVSPIEAIARHDKVFHNRPNA